MRDRDRVLDEARLRAFGQRITQLRTALGLSQEAFAHKANLDRSYVGGVERGERNVSLANIWVLADTLGVSPGVLFESPTTAGRRGHTPK